VTPAALEVVAAAARQAVPLDRIEAGERGRDAVSVYMDGHLLPLPGRSVAPQYELVLCVECYHHRPLADIARRRVEAVERRVAHGRPS
jgi:hypothetical protein